VDLERLQGRDVLAMTDADGCPETCIARIDGETSGHTAERGRHRI
jgi:hypothetical protein